MKYPDKPSRTQPLEDARTYVKSHIKEGVTCPCCGQFVKLYSRKLNSSMAYGLILLTHNRNGIDTSDWFHLENYLKPLNIPATLRGDLPKLRHWGFMEAEDGQGEDGNPRLGYYRVTTFGRRFANGEVKVKSHANLYNQRFLGLTGDDIDIHEALGNKFNYAELMGRMVV